MPKLEITPRERSTLRAAAHPLRPVVLIGDAGLSEAVLKEIDVHLGAHGLIKVRAGGQDRDEREAMLGTICDTLSCAAVHHLGKMLILYRPESAKPVAGMTPQAETQETRRRPADPHTPKKLAAEGKVLTRKDVRAARKADRPEDDTSNQSPRERYLVLNKSGKPVRPGTKAPATARPGVVRRTGSALSLRSGARRTGLSGSGIVRKSIRSVKK